MLTGAFLSHLLLCSLEAAVSHLPLCCPEAAIYHLLLCHWRLPYLTCCLTATGGCSNLPAAVLPENALSHCCPEDALSHLLPGGCPVSPAARRMPCLTCCPEDALSHLLPGGCPVSPAARRMPYLTCFLLPGGCPVSLLPGGCPVSLLPGGCLISLLPGGCHLSIFPCGAVVSDLLVLPPGDWSVLTCRLLIERCRVSLPGSLPTGGCSSFFLPSADWRLPGLSTCCVVWMEAAVDLVPPATSLPRGHSRSDAVSLFMGAQSPYMSHCRKSPW